MLADGGGSFLRPFCACCSLLDRPTASQPTNTQTHKKREKWKKNGKGALNKCRPNSQTCKQEKWPNAADFGAGMVDIKTAASKQTAVPAGKKLLVSTAATTTGGSDHHQQPMAAAATGAGQHWMARSWHTFCDAGQKQQNIGRREKWMNGWMDSFTFNSIIFATTTTKHLSYRRRWQKKGGGGQIIFKKRMQKKE